MINKELAAYWHAKLMRTPASYQALATYRFRKWKQFEVLARDEEYMRLRRESNVEKGVILSSTYAH
ncbi:hypothetical protein [Levilactobacillus brevis]|uniref:hypothetical protein n=1 Tax=Levilactobacillus brevis TaxID=1580 RepID=UPI0021A4E31E|nr:hypothetical protein [Levilactobacillus brevis]MCT3574139.1 hypothetical protein [Levilactobacillus brevis]